jgi:hypothetical protein
MSSGFLTSIDIPWSPHPMRLTNITGPHCQCLSLTREGGSCQPIHQSAPTFLIPGQRLSPQLALDTVASKLIFSIVFIGLSMPISNQATVIVLV